MKFLNILFLAIPKSEYDFVRYRHSIDLKAFSFSSEEIIVKFLRHYESDYLPTNYDQNEYFFKGKNQFFFFPLSLYIFVKKENPDVVFIHGFVFPFQVLFLKWFISSQTKIIVQHHAEKPFRNKIKLWFQKLAYSKADAYLFSAKELANEFIRHKIISSEKSVFEVMEGSSLFTKRERNGLRKQLNIKAETVFLWVGRLDLNKDPLTVLKAFNKYKNLVSGFKLYMIYGTSELEDQIKTFISENDLSHNIILIGKVPHDDLENWYNAADYFVSASHYEGSGIALCEAMACGCIPLVSDISSFRKMTNGGKCGFLFNAGDDQDLLMKLNALKKEDKKEMEEKVLLQFQRELSFEAISKKIEAISKNLQKNRDVYLVKDTMGS